jgi:hypothetical protein
MKAIYLALCLLLVLAGTALAYTGYDDYSYDDSSYYDTGDYSSCCCGPVFVLLAAGAFALHGRR